MNLLKVKYNDGNHLHYKGTGIIRMLHLVKKSLPNGQVYYRCEICGDEFLRYEL